ncbi:MAG: hypothetical protein SCALA702_03070 [Melioribacteraceae bacterium]|nr:MAG: hypothetical protein SCALA702_03070 [Melioribacteraceae bacterium]
MQGLFFLKGDATRLTLDHPESVRDRFEPWRDNKKLCKYAGLFLFKVSDLNPNPFSYKQEKGLNNKTFSYVPLL